MKRTIVLLIAVIAFSVLATTVMASEEEAPAPVSGSEVMKTEATKGFAAIGIACVVGMAFAAVGVAIGQSIAAKAALTGTARQPEASGKLQIQMILAVVFMETLAIYTLVVALILLFVNPLTKLIG